MHKSRYESVERYISNHWYNRPEIYNDMPPLYDEAIYQRLRGFEAKIPSATKVFANDYDDPRYLATESVPAAATPTVVPE